MITADVSVRPAVPDDAPRIAALQLDAWRSSLGGDAVAGLAAEEIATTWAAAITSAPDRRSRVLVALAGLGLAGFAAFTPARRADEEVAPPEWTAEIVALEVAEPYRRQGHGSRLLAAVVDVARDSGAHHVAAWSLAGDTVRIAFLESAGLAEVGVRRRLATPGGEVEEILLTGALGREPATRP